MKTMKTNEGEIPQYDLPDLPTTISAIYDLALVKDEQAQAVLRIINRLIVAHKNKLITEQEVRGELCAMPFNQAIENVIHLYTADKYTIEVVSWHDVINRLTPNDPEAIHSTWGIADIQGTGNGKYLTDEAARDVLGVVEQKHDASVGIDWIVLDVHIDHFFEGVDDFDPIKIEYWSDPELLELIWGEEWWESLNHLLMLIRDQIGHNLLLTKEEADQKRTEIVQQAAILRDEAEELGE